MQIVDNRALLLRVRNPAVFTSAIPKCREFPNNVIVVNWGVDEARVLRNLNVKNVPSPILGKYAWPGMHKPFEHQKTTSAFLTLNQRAFCFNEQGTGKTSSAIWASDFLLTQGVVNRVLIICPLSIMDAAWVSDLFKVAMHRSVGVAYGTKAARVEVLQSGCEYMVINYDGIAVIRDELAAGGFDLIIVDEANHYKNPSTKRWKTLYSLITPKTWLWMMTGTPAAQSPVDAYGLARLVNPKAVPRYLNAFREIVMQKLTQFKWVPRSNASSMVHSILQPAIRFTKEQCLDLPEMTYVKRSVELTKQQQTYYKKLKNDMTATIGDSEVTAVNAAIVMNKLLQISCGAVYTTEGDTVEFDISNRYTVLREVIEESSQKVLIFVPFRHVIVQLSEKLAADGITNEVVHGDVPVNKRTKVFDEFQTKKDPHVLIIQPQAAAHGVTLTAANTIVWWGPVPSVETYMQANARVHRPGQKHPTTVVQLQGSDVEKRVYYMLDNNINVHTKIVDLYNELLD